MKPIRIIVMSLVIIWLVNLTPLEAIHAKQVVITKTYELTSSTAYIEFQLDGYDGKFTSTLKLPDGHIITNTKSTNINDPDKAYWVNAYRINKASKGKYTFTIQAPKQGYYNLRVDIPLFSDIAGHWAKKEITEFVQKGIVGGYGNGKFGPNDPVTGEALIKMVVVSLTEEQSHGKRQWLRTFRWRVKDEEKSAELGKQEYDFVAKSGEHWSVSYLSAASNLGVSSKWSDMDLKGAFKRKDVALLVASVLQLVKDDKVKVIDYQDTATLSADYRKAIDIVSNFNIFSGYPGGSFKPELPVTRAEAVKVLAKLLAFMQ